MLHRQTIIESLERRLMLAAQAQAYDWNSATIKGDGFIDGIVYSQAATDVAYAHADIGGAYRLDPTTNTWIPLTDWITSSDNAQYNGAVTMAVDPTNPNNVYLVSGTYQSTAAFLRSTDQGRTWQRTDVSGIKVDGNGWGRGIGERLAVDPNLPSVLFYGANYFDTSHRGLWESTTSGATWNQLGSFTNYGDVWPNPVLTTPGGNYVSANGVGLPFVIFDKSSGTAGFATPRIYVASDSAANTATKLYTTSNGGTSWTLVANQPTTTNFPLRATLSADGSVMYVTYGSQAGPISSNDTGVLYKITNPSSANAVWTNITPPALSGMPTPVAIDPTNSNIVYTAAQNNFPCPIYRSTDGGTTWSTITNWTYNSPGPNRIDTSAPYAASQNVHWLTDIEIDPSNHNVAMFNTGYGIYRTTNLTATTPTWSFYNNGLEESAAAELVSPPSGTTHLIDAIGDRDGFKQIDLTVSPASGQLSPHMGSNSDIAIAWNNVNDMVRAGGTSPYAQYSLDEGTTWSYFGSVPSGTSGDGQIEISADGTMAVWDPPGGALVYSTRTGSMWSAWTAPTWPTTGSPTGAPAGDTKLVADLVESKTFYAYYSGGPTLWMSTNGGATWSVQASGSSSSISGATWIRAVPGNAGNLYMSRGGSGLYFSSNHGVTWTRVNSGAVTAANQVGIGAAAPGKTYPAIFIGGTVSGQTGFFRSDDQGATWVQISDLSHAYGSITVIQGDPQIYGRLYLGINGRGILYADIHNPSTTLPGGWATSDIGSPGSTGSAGQLSGGTTWDIVGGGAGVTGTLDAFRFAYTSLTGNGSITALVSDVPNGSPGNYNAEAGIMIRDGVAANSANAFLALTPGSVNGAIFQTRTAPGATTGTIGAATTGVYPPYWLRLTRAGNVITAFISANGTTWSQIGSQTIAMSSTINIGLAVTASNNNQVDISHFQNVSITTPPVVTQSSYLVNTALNQLSFTFDQDVSATLLASSLTVSPGNFTATSVSWNAAAKTATFTLPIASLTNGYFTATLNGAATKSVANDLMTSNPTLQFLVLQGDANRDGTVNALDLNAIATNFGAPGPHTLSDGDVDYDGQIGISDFNTLASNFGVSVPTGAAIPSAVAQSSTTPDLFSATSINRLDDILQ
jgi:hypothetical protein